VISIRMGTIPQIRLMRRSSWAPGDETAVWEPIPGAPEVDPGWERYTPIVNDLIAAIEQDREPVTSLRDGANAYEMIQAVFDSHAQGGQVSIPLKRRSHPLKRWREQS
jgi:hypothetical protein